MKCFGWKYRDAYYLNLSHGLFQGFPWNDFAWKYGDPWFSPLIRGLVDLFKHVRTMSGGAQMVAMSICFSRLP